MDSPIVVGSAVTVGGFVVTVLSIVAAVFIVVASIYIDKYTKKKKECAKCIYEIKQTCTSKCFNAKLDFKNNDGNDVRTQRVNFDFGNENAPTDVVLRLNCQDINTRNNYKLYYSNLTKDYVDVHLVKLSSTSARMYIDVPRPYTDLNIGRGFKMFPINETGGVALLVGWKIGNDNVFNVYVSNDVFSGESLPITNATLANPVNALPLSNVLSGGIVTKGKTLYTFIVDRFVAHYMNTIPDDPSFIAKNNNGRLYILHYNATSQKLFVSFSDDNFDTLGGTVEVTNSVGDTSVGMMVKSDGSIVVLNYSGTNNVTLNVHTSNVDVTSFTTTTISYYVTTPDRLIYWSSVEDYSKGDLWILGSQIGANGASQADAMSIVIHKGVGVANEMFDNCIVVSPPTNSYFDQPLYIATASTNELGTLRLSFWQGISETEFLTSGYIEKAQGATKFSGAVNSDSIWPTRIQTYTGNVNVGINNSVVGFVYNVDNQIDRNKPSGSYLSVLSFGKPVDTDVTVDVTVF